MIQVNEALLAIYTGQVHRFEFAWLSDPRMDSFTLARYSATNSGQDGSKTGRYGWHHSIGESGVIHSGEKIRWCNSSVTSQIWAHHLTDEYRFLLGFPRKWATTTLLDLRSLNLRSTASQSRCPWLVQCSFAHFVSSDLGKVNQACDYLRKDEELLVKPGIVRAICALLLSSSTVVYFRSRRWSHSTII